MGWWIVDEGDVSPLDIDRLPPRDRYGADWILVEATDKPEALARAEAYGSTGGDIEQQMFAVGYRQGMWGLPGDDLVGVAEIARRAGVAWSTVQSWRRRHRDFPAPVKKLDMGPVWWWSDVARWTARERRPGRRKR